MQTPQINVDRNGPVPTIELRVGQAHVGEFATYLWTPTPTLVKAGPTDDVFNIGPSVQNLHGRLFTWNLGIQYQADGSKTYSATAVITQGEGTLYEEHYPDPPGQPMDGDVLIVRGVRFHVA